MRVKTLAPCPHRHHLHPIRMYLPLIHQIPTIDGSILKRLLIIYSTHFRKKTNPRYLVNVVLSEMALIRLFPSVWPGPRITEVNKQTSLIAFMTTSQNPQQATPPQCASTGCYFSLWFCTSGFVRLQVMENLYYILEELAFPTPKGFTSEFASLGLKYLPRSVFMQYMVDIQAPCSYLNND